MWEVIYIYRVKSGLLSYGNTGTMKFLLATATQAHKSQTAQEIINYNSFIQDSEDKKDCKIKALVQ